jgi:prefoldin subunit 5
MEWNVFIDWALKAVLGGVAFHGVHVLSEMKKSIDSLNNKMAKLIERTEWHSKEIDRIEARILRLEEKGA